MKIGRHARAGLAALALSGAACLEVEDTGHFVRELRERLRPASER